MFFSFDRMLSRLSDCVSDESDDNSHSSHQDRNESEDVKSSKELMIRLMDYR